jgi:uncharacterized protein (DUF885 family)
MGDKFTEKFFHDTVIANGYVPLSLLRNIFNQKLGHTRS